MNLAARCKVLALLLKLSHEGYAEEIGQGQQVKKTEGQDEPW
jgi:hypothetical protein